jgi:hypothetical protein
MPAIGWPTLAPLGNSGCVGQHCGVRCSVNGSVHCIEAG